MKKYIYILFAVTILSLTCACGQVNVNTENVQISHTADMPGIIKPIKELDIIWEEVRRILPEDYIAQNPYDERCLWYMDVDSFLSQYGFAESTPFYEYALPDGNIRLTLYYDEKTGLGCGIRHFERDPSDIMTSGLCGFTFVGMSDETGNLWGGLSVDYTKFETCDGDNGSAYVSAYKENKEYNDAGKVVHFDSSGLYEVGDEEPSYCLFLDDNLGWWMPEFARY